MNVAIRADLFGDLVPVSSGRFLSTTADRMADVERRRLIHRVIQARLATAALLSERWYRRISQDPSLATEAVVIRLETALRGLIAADAKAAAKAPLPLLPAVFGAIFHLACTHYGVAPDAARTMLEGEERPGSLAWRAASHARQAALYLTNQVLAVSQAELAALIGKSPAAVCLALRAVEDRRDDEAGHPGLDGFLERAPALLSWGPA